MWGGACYDIVEIVEALSYEGVGWKYILLGYKKSNMIMMTFPNVSFVYEAGG